MTYDEALAQAVDIPREEMEHLLDSNPRPTLYERPLCPTVVHFRYVDEDRPGGFYYTV